MNPSEVVVSTSVGPDQETGFFGNCAPNCRWGDYAAASPDPTTPGTVWVTNMAIGPFNAGFAQWFTTNGSLSTAQ
jgi:hypothetical protein